MKRVTGFVLLFLLGAALNLSLRAQGTDDVTVDATKMAQINRLAAAANLQEMIVEKFKEGMQEGMSAMEAEGSGLPAGFAKNFADRFAERFDPDDFLAQVIAPVLDAHFTTEELGLVADFVESDLGRKLIQAKLSGEETDVQAMLAAGEISEEDGTKMMQLLIRLGKKKNLVEDGTLSKDIEERSRVYGEALAMEIISDMMEEYMEEGAETEMEVEE